MQKVACFIIPLLLPILTIGQGPATLPEGKERLALYDMTKPGFKNKENQERAFRAVQSALVGCACFDVRLNLDWKNVGSTPSVLPPTEREIRDILEGYYFNGRNAPTEAEIERFRERIATKYVVMMELEYNPENSKGDYELNLYFVELEDFDLLMSSTIPIDKSKIAEKQKIQADVLDFFQQSDICRTASPRPEIAPEPTTGDLRKDMERLVFLENFDPDDAEIQALAERLRKDPKFEPYYWEAQLKHHDKERNRIVSLDELDDRRWRMLLMHLQQGISIQEKLIDLNSDPEKTDQLKRQLNKRQRDLDDWLYWGKPVFGKR